MSTLLSKLIDNLSEIYSKKYRDKKSLKGLKITNFLIIGNSVEKTVKT